MLDLTDHEKTVLDEFLAERWEAFKSHCETHGEDANDITEKLGGERDD